MSMLTDPRLTQYKGGYIVVMAGICWCIYPFHVYRDAHVFRAGTLY